MAKKAISVLMVSLVVVAMVAGCALGPARSQKPGPDWSRGVQVGEGSFNDPVALQPAPTGEHVHMAWGQVSTEGDRIRYVQLSSQAAVLAERDLPFKVKSPRQVQLMPDGGNGLILCWLSGISEKRRLFAAHLDPLGQPLSEPLQLPGVDVEVSEYVAVSTPTAVEVLWSHNGAGAARGIYHARLDLAGRLLAPSKLIIPGGISPSAQADRQGRLHVTWIDEPGYFEENVYYGAFDPVKQELGQELQVGFFTLSLKTSRYGPVLALDNDWAYIFWSWEQLAAGQAAIAGEGECRYVAIPVGGGKVAEERALELSPAARLAYQSAQGLYGYTQLAPTTGDTSPLIYMPNPAAGQDEEVALSIAYESLTRTRRWVQIGVVYLAGGAVRGYQVAARGSSLVMRPVLAADGHHRLHLAWLEAGGFNRYLVYYAGTNPETREALGRIGRQDVTDALLSLVWRVAQSAGMFPVAFFWVFIPLIWVIGYYIVKADGQLDRRGPRIALGVAIALYVFAKFLLLPASFLNAAPLMDRVPPAVGELIFLGVPLVILLGALGMLRLYMKRAENPSLLQAYLVFVATDALVTCFLYAPALFE